MGNNTLQPTRGFLTPNPHGNASHIPRSIQALQSIKGWQYQQIGGVDLWLRMEIAIAFQQFLCMRLGNTPAVEMLPFTAESWVSIVGEGMTEGADRERIKQGFNQLYRSLKWWPQPAELLNILPRRIMPKPSVKAQAAEDADIDTSSGSEKLQDILDQLEAKEREGNHGA